VYDFRKSRTLFGPISDVIPSTAVFEMYPIGLTTIASHLEEAGFNVELVNVAYRMLRDARYDAEVEIARRDPLCFGIDLHWLPHAHGSLELARLVKKAHPHTPVVMGGLSASYYHEELIRRPDVDFVMRGDSTEEPMLRLMRVLRLGGAFEDVPNLTWKRPDGSVVVNALSHVPDRIDDLALPNYEYVIRSVFKYGSLANVVPHLDWLSYPITAILTSRGCTQNCSICGGSRFAYRRILGRKKPAFRSPEALVRDIRKIQEFSKAPIFLIHDVRQGGRRYFDRFLEALARERIENELIFELFFPAGDEFFGKIAEVVPKFSVELTLETHVEALRRFNGKFACSNAEVEATLESALRLLERFHGSRRLWFFVAPLAPFLDPGSLAFEFPERYGYRSLYRSLEEHRRALTAPSWKHILSYETDAMTRDEIVDATYEASSRLNWVKLQYGLMEAPAYREMEARITASRRMIAEIDAALQLPEGPERDERLQALNRAVAGACPAGLDTKQEMRWPIRRRFATAFRLTRVLVRLIATEVRLLVTKRARLALETFFRSWRRVRPVAAARPAWGGSAGFLDVRASVDAAAPGEGDPGEDRERASDL
jgi:hypothetical protein